MAKVYIKALKPFTRRIGAQIVVGHPKHPDPKGRYAEVDESAALGKLISGGYAERVTKQTYNRAMDAEPATAGDALTDQVAGKAARASITMSDGQLQQLAAQRDVDISKAKSRAQIVKLINAKKVDTAAGNLPDNAFARTSGETRDTTLHPPSTGTQADVTEQGTTSRSGFSKTGVTTEGEANAELAPEEEAPTHGGSGGGDSDGK